MAIKQPVTQVKLTNVAVVRMKFPKSTTTRSSTKRFEVACYKNKLVDYRAGIEKDIDEVVQIMQVFTNVSKGVTANKADLEEAFGHDNINLIVRNILDKGEIQISEKERQQELEAKFREIATMVADKTINRETKRPFTVTMIEQAMREAHVSVNMGKPAKQQALQCIAKLKETLPLDRAQMRLHLMIPSAVGKQIKNKIAPLIAHFEEEEWGADYDTTVLIDPGKFRMIEEVVQSNTKGRGQIEIMDHKVTHDTDYDLEALETDNL